MCAFNTPFFNKHNASNLYLNSEKCRTMSYSFPFFLFFFRIYLNVQKGRNGKYSFTNTFDRKGTYFNLFGLYYVII